MIRYNADSWWGIFITEYLTWRLKRAMAYVRACDVAAQNAKLRHQNSLEWLQFWRLRLGKHIDEDVTK